MAALRTSLALAVAAVVGCGGAPTPPARHRAAAGDDITLYRDVALIRQRVTKQLPAGASTLEIVLAAGVASDQIAVTDRGGLTITGVHAKIDAIAEEVVDAVTVVKPTLVRVDVVAPRAGAYELVVGYPTKRLVWDVAYTMIASPARDRGELRGAVAIRNETGIQLRASAARVVDAELSAWRTKTAEHLAASLVGGTRSSTPPATPRELGALWLGGGETRVELTRDEARRIRSVLVYDPIGTKLDNPGAAPLRDVDLGVRPPASSRVSESFEVARDARTTAGLPGGPVRLLARRADGSLAVLGEARLFDAATRVSDVDTIAVGTAQDVTATRERREITVDEDNKRLVEEFAITIDNKRAHPVEVLVREHLYRGQNWTLAYHSAPAASKEGPQQISLRTKVPARSTSKILYVVVYTWTQ